jgi:hypothetical protein
MTTRKTRSHGWKAALIFACLFGLLAAGCATPPPDYGPDGGGGSRGTSLPSSPN